MSIVVAIELDVFFNDAATTDIYTLSLHDALPIFQSAGGAGMALSQWMHDGQKP